MASLALRLPSARGLLLHRPPLASTPRAVRRPLRLMASASTTHKLDEEAVAVINKQLLLYNARDLEPFMGLMADDIVVSDGETGAILATGKEQLRPRYVERFKTDVHAELLGRLCLGNTVIDREIISGLPDGGIADCMATYLVRDGKIAKMQFVWRPRTQGARM